MDAIDLTPGAPGVGKNIDRVWIALAEARDGTGEGVVAYGLARPGMVPVLATMVTATESGLERMRQQAREVAHATGQKIRIVEFAGRKDLEVIG